MITSAVSIFNKFCYFYISRREVRKENDGMKEKRAQEEAVVKIVNTGIPWDRRRTRYTEKDS